MNGRWPQQMLLVIHAPALAHAARAADPSPLDALLLLVLGPESMSMLIMSSAAAGMRVPGP